MSEQQLPRWDVEPELSPRESLPIPEKADKNWCAMVNYLYAGKGYRTELMAAVFLRSKLTSDGRPIPAEYTWHEIREGEEELTPHTFAGFLKSIEIKPALKSEVQGPLIEQAYARLGYAFDIDSGEQLGAIAGQDIVVPLSRTNELILERF
jgi:hypothetical protein